MPSQRTPPVTATLCGLTHWLLACVSSKSAPGLPEPLFHTQHAHKVPKPSAAGPLQVQDGWQVHAVSRRTVPGQAMLPARCLAGVLLFELLIPGLT